MSAPEWWVIALPALLVVAAIIGGLYANVKTLYDIKKTQLDIEKAKFELQKLKLDAEKIALETQKLRSDIADKDKHVVVPTDAEMERFIGTPSGVGASGVGLDQFLGRLGITEEMMNSLNSDAFHSASWADFQALWPKVLLFALALVEIIRGVTWLLSHAAS
jgi:hypothetical protein